MIHACDQNGPPTNLPSELFGNFQAFCLLIKLGVCGSGHFVCVDVAATVIGKEESGNDEKSDNKYSRGLRLK